MKMLTEEQQGNVVTIPLTTTISYPRCPQCPGHLRPTSRPKYKNITDTNDVPVVEAKCPTCGFEAMYPLPISELAYDNAHTIYDNAFLRRAHGHMGVVSMIMARDQEYGIGKDGDMPWGRSLPTDLKWFKHITTHNPDALLVVGNTTFEKLPKLPNRKIAILTSKVSEKTESAECDGWYYPDISTLLADNKETDLIVIGGGYVYEQWLPLADVIYETVVGHTFEVDTYGPVFKPRHPVRLHSGFVSNCDGTGIAVAFNIWLSAAAVGTPLEDDVRQRCVMTSEPFLRSLGIKEK